MDLFEYTGRKESLLSSPLSSRMRPKNIDEFIGQEHILGEGKSLYNLIQNGTIPSMIFWGPPGTGKTTLAKIIADKSNMNFKPYIRFEILDLLDPNLTLKINQPESITKRAR